MLQLNWIIINLSFSLFIIYVCYIIYTLNFDILLTKLDHYGVNESAKRLIHSYLTDRSQYVEFNGHKSVNLPIFAGVPQGSA